MGNVSGARLVVAEYVSVEDTSALFGTKGRAVVTEVELDPLWQIRGGPGVGHGIVSEGFWEGFPRGFCRIIEINLYAFDKK